MRDVALSVNVKKKYVVTLRNFSEKLNGRPTSCNYCGNESFAKSIHSVSSNHITKHVVPKFGWPNSL